MEYLNLAFIAFAAFVYSVTLRQLEHNEITGPMFFVLLGFLLTWVDPVIDINFLSSSMQLIIELTLASVLFVDAANADLKILRRNYTYPLLLLIVALPLTFIFSALTMNIFFTSLPFLSSALVAIIITPTDAALSRSFLKAESVPITLREGINTESGLNDGLCVPIFLFLLAAATHQTNSRPLTLAVELLSREIGIAIFVAFISMAIVLLMVHYCENKHYFINKSSPFLFTAIAVFIYSFTQAIEGSGFIAVFISGLIFDWFYKGQAKNKFVKDSEQLSDFMSAIIWCFFGFTAFNLLVNTISVAIICYALLSLTVLRMLPVIFSLYFTQLSVKEKITFGWFGPRGMASIVFALMLYQSEIANKEFLVSICFTVILLSVVIHGLSTQPIIKLFKQKKAE
ncbi:cation:proton antiporter [Pseudoalteromonas ulvae]|uniref:Cation/H+ exchanger transmembrane domain-containing protein n=1 Tax=Pseudoalteromonas ulvae TaxID=107327 RepID=A0A244CR09_PSEDV|nr:cation:proton antiporter [Pseudoalteromonas ulvae]OUL58067.1 hypothetical protein B1199_06855 [Pseudoalteromonas ulvae]